MGMRTAVSLNSVGEVIEADGIRSAYQPIVDLATRQTIAFEALARGPQGSDFESPAQLFPAAAAAGLSKELERAALSAAFRGTVGRLGEGSALFVNLEPGLLGEEELEELLQLSELIAGRIAVFIELTERQLVSNPMQLLRSVDRMREMGIRIALDDVGADSTSLALLPFVDPEVIKLDLSLVHDHPRGQVAEIIHAVNAEAERTGALIVAEGIEHKHHLERAGAIGAHLGQGWLFGRPGPLEPSGPWASATFRLRDTGFERTPFEIVSANRETRLGDKRLLLALSLELEAHAELHGESTTLLSTFQHSRFFTPRVAARYEPLTQALPVVGALAHGPRPEGVPKLRWGDLAAGDPLLGEWNVAVVAPHFTAAFVARDLGDEGPDMDRRFEFVITYERGLAIRAARSMMRRLAAQQAGPA